MKEPNTEGRIKLLMERFEISPSSLADTIGIKRAAVSHLLSGRNKASLDVVQKILTTIPELNPTWLIFGNTNMFVHPINQDDEQLITERFVEKKKPELEQPSLQENPTPTPIPLPPTSPDKKVERIVIFYDDKTFETYSPSN